MSNTVFVLGSGFSAPADIPVQERIMDNISHSLIGTKYYKGVKEFYQSVFNITNPKEFCRVPLEDVFTFIDRAISGQEDTNRVPIEKIYAMKGSFKGLIAMVLDKKLCDFANNSRFREARDIYKNFFDILIKKRTMHQEDDPFSIVTLNWDTIPEYFINTLSRNKKIKGNKKIQIDYTCYDYDYYDKKKETHIPSIHLKKLGHFNIKLQKLHGSLNWAYCSSCGRLFIRKSRRPLVSRTIIKDNVPVRRLLVRNNPPVFFESQDNKCHSCTNVRLKRLLITPTLTKDLNNTHLKMVWHNALMDLQQAKRIVFIGYSFPLADFEFRYLLSKAIVGSDKPREKKIRVVLYPPEPPLESEMKKLSWMKKRWQRDLEEDRYKNFFGKLDFDCKYMDAIDFIQDPDLIWNW